MYRSLYNVCLCARAGVRPVDCVMVWKSLPRFKGIKRDTLKRSQLSDDGRTCWYKVHYQSVVSSLIAGHHASLECCSVLSISRCIYYSLALLPWRYIRVAWELPVFLRSHYRLLFYICYQYLVWLDCTEHQSWLREPSHSLHLVSVILLHWRSQLLLLPNF